MRDFFDVYTLAARRSFESETLSRALEATFKRRRTALPDAWPAELMAALLAAGDKRAQ